MVQLFLILAHLYTSVDIVSEREVGVGEGTSVPNKTKGRTDSVTYLGMHKVCIYGPHI